jgi:Tol biopolymer transport system component
MLRPLGLSNSLLWLVSLAAAAAIGCGSSRAPRAASPPGTHPPPRPIRLADLHGQIVFSRRDDIWSANADGSRLRRLTFGRGPEFDPSWSPDGTRIVYRDSRRGINNNDEIYVMNSDGRRPRNLTHGPINEWSPSWSPDGNLIAFFSGEVYAMRPDGSDARAITKIEGEYPAWSRDGRRLAFMSAEPDARGGDPNYDVFVISRNGNGLRRLTDWPGEDGWPTWSPDGHWIAFSSTHGASTGHLLLYLMRSDGTDKHLLVRKVEGDFPVWSPDGNAIMFSGGDHDHLWVVRQNGTGLRELPLTGWLPDWHQP